MRDPKYLIFLDLIVAVLVVGDLIRTRKTGHARGRRGTITRAHQPARYRRYVYSSYAVLVFLLITFLWVTIWPDSLR